MSDEKDYSQDEEFNLDGTEFKEIPTFDASKQTITELGDGTEIISDNFENDSEEEEKEELSDDALLRIVEFATGRKDVTKEELDAIREDDDRLEKLIRITAVKSSKLTYNPKKKFGVKYKKERQRKNREVKRSRIINRKK